MNWDAISGIGELIGAIAVVVTLIYLSREIRQNSKAVTLTALRDATDRWNHWSEMLATSPDLASIVAKGNRDYESLSEAEALRYGAFMQSFFDNVDSNRTLAQEHHNIEDMDVLKHIVSRRISTPGMSAWWIENTADYDADFIQWIEDIRRRP